jgi:hypothetical protein
MTLQHRLPTLSHNVIREASFLALATALLFSVAISGRCSAQPCVKLSGVTHTEDFDSLAASGSSNVDVPPGFSHVEFGTSANTTYAADDGSDSAANTYSYGTGTNTDRALGEVTSGTVRPFLGACFVNDTNHVVSSFVVGYTGEEWRLAAADATTDRLDFQFSTNATSLHNGTWTDADALDFVTPNNNAPAGAKDGNAAENRFVFAPFAITPPGGVQDGASFLIRWVSTNISGSDDGLAIDDFSIGTTLLPGLAGDYNQNGAVDLADYAVWRRNLGQSVTIANDTTPGTVTTADYDVWWENFGLREFGGGALAPVPEPAGLLFAALGASLLAVRRPTRSPHAR